ncbi:AmmeMemoRadiSam system protein B [Dehalococcoidales bacterium]|nr:AmmeMemoRadiSam system protein B [Dehalococcoidales bacterium]MCL0094823.1 AmmeMemoRadiSam system protein B [Dehalococcoidales bacterium]
MIRNPVVSGQFYPASSSQLKAMIDRFIDKKVVKEEVIGLISPHAGYVYSGAVAGAVISKIKFKDTFIILGPNHTGRGKPLSIITQGVWKTPLGEVEIDSELGKQILATSSHLAEDQVAHQYEHSIEVQLPFLQYFKPDIRIVPIMLAYATGAIYKEMGKELARAIKQLNKEVVIIASTDMTHYEPQEVAQRKDNKAIEAILNLDEDELLKRVDELNISMCGYAPTVSLISAAKELGATRAELVRYQTSGDTTGDYSSVVGYAGIIITGMHPLVRLAKETVETFVTQGKTPQPKELTPEMRERAGVFVSIKKFGELRGCIGTFEPTQPNVAEEIITNAISSATRDPRFPPVSPNELKELSYSVDVLTPPQPIPDKDQLDPKRYGVIVEAGFRRGLLLPDLEGVDSVDYQIEICRQKAGIMPNEPIKLYRFEVKRYK